MEVIMKHLWAAGAILALTACDKGLTTPDPVDCYPCLTPKSICEPLNNGQKNWCNRIAGHPCNVLLTGTDKGWAAWVDWSDDYTVYWNNDVVSNPHWISECRMAHEACHITGLHDEVEADQCASRATRRNCVCRDGSLCLD